MKSIKIVVYTTLIFILFTVKTYAQQPVTAKGFIQSLKSEAQKEANKEFDKFLERKAKNIEKIKNLEQDKSELDTKIQKAKDSKKLLNENPIGKKEVKKLNKEIASYEKQKKSIEKNILLLKDKNLKQLDKSDALKEKALAQKEKIKKKQLKKFHNKEKKLNKLLAKATGDRKELLNSGASSDELTQINKKVDTYKDQKEEIQKRVKQLSEVKDSKVIDQLISEGTDKVLKGKQAGIKEITSKSDPDYKKLLLKNTPELKDRLFFEGVLGISQNSANILNLSSMAGYQLNDRFSFGIGGGYQRFTNTDNPLKGMFNLNVMGRMELPKGFYLQIENQLLFSKKDITISESPNQLKTTQLIGAGWKVPMEKSVRPLHFRIMLQINSGEAQLKAENPLQFLIGYQF